jgi:hypothetical protein
MLRVYQEKKMDEAQKDPPDLSPQAWGLKHVDKGSFAVFDSDIAIHADYAVQQMKFCPLVEAWQEMGCSTEEIDLFCDIAMAGDRGRAAGHGVKMELNQTIGKGDTCCRLVIKNQPGKRTRKPTAAIHDDTSVKRVAKKIHALKAIITQWHHAPSNASTREVVHEKLS